MHPEELNVVQPSRDGDNGIRKIKALGERNGFRTQVGYRKRVGEGSNSKLELNVSIFQGYTPCTRFSKVLKLFPLSVGVEVPLTRTSANDVSAIELAIEPRISTFQSLHHRACGHYIHRVVGSWGHQGVKGCRLSSPLRPSSLRKG